MAETSHVKRLPRISKIKSMNELQEAGSRKQEAGHEVNMSFVFLHYHADSCLHTRAVMILKLKIKPGHKPSQSNITIWDEGAAVRQHLNTR